jgi:hypothetical protein
MPTLKLFPVPIRLPFNWVDVSASGASFAGISRWNQDNQHTSDCSLVVNEQSELIKRQLFVLRLSVFLRGFSLRLSRIPVKSSKPTHYPTDPPQLQVVC